MTTATLPEKVFFGIIFLAALYVGAAGFFFPAHLAEVFTWMTLPPLHARFLGSIYLYGTLFMLLCLLASRWTQIASAIIAIAIWTGMMFVTSLLNLNAFDLSQTATWGWFLSYSIYPIIAILLVLYRSRQPVPTAPAPDASIPSWVYTFLMVQGAFLTALALLLLVVPDFMTSVWPWKMTTGIAQFYSGPLIAYAFTGIRFARARTWADLRVLLPAMLLFSVCALIASVLHIGLFSFANISTWLWFAALLVMAAFQGAIIFRATKSTVTASTAPSAAS